MFHCCFFFFILSPNWASRETAAAACKCPRGEHMFSDVWGFVSIWENDERELGANDPTYWLANAVLDTTLGNVTESICQFVSRGLQITTVWLSHFEWILCFFFFLRKTPTWWNVFKGLSRSFTTVTQFFGRFFTVSFAVNYQNAAFCFHCQNSKETEQRWEWKFRFQKSRTAVANTLSSSVARLFYYCHAFLVVTTTTPAPLSENCCLFYFHNPIILLREMVKVSALSGEPCTGGNCDLLRGWRTFIEWFHFQIQILFFHILKSIK